MTGHEHRDDVEERLVVGHESYVVTFPGGERKSYSSGEIQQEELRNAFAIGLRGLLAFSSRISSLRTVDSYLVAFRNFSRYLSSERIQLSTMETLEAHHLDGFELWLRRRYAPASQEPFVQTTRVVLTLREFGRRQAGELSVATLQRLERTALGPTGHTNRLDAYSAFVAGQLRKGSRRDVDDAVKRLDEGKALLLQGRDPDVYGWDEPNLLWLAANRGPLQHRTLEQMSWPMIAKTYRVGDINRRLFLTHDDVFAFWVYLSLETGLPIESIKTLKADCLRNADKRWVHLSYRKNRRHGHEENTKRIRNGGVRTAGGLLKLAISLTALARSFSATNDLWVAYGGGGAVGVPTMPANRRLERPAAATRFTTRHNIVDDDGTPLHLQLNRLRKTKKAENYRLLKGDVAAVADDHSVEVSASRYGNIPSLAATHEQAIQDGLQEALDTFTVRVTSQDEEIRMRSDPIQASRDLGTAAQTIQEIVAGARDVWVSNCTNFFESPFGQSGRPCPAAVWGCLDCPNAIITSDRLPALVAFQRHMRDQRPIMDEQEWRAMYERAALRVEQVLTAFPKELVDAAKLIADGDGDSAALYLPIRDPGVRSRRASGNRSHR